MQVQKQHRPQDGGKNEQAAYGDLKRSLGTHYKILAEFLAPLTFV